MGEAPTIAWTKLLGGGSQDAAYEVSTASDGSIYIAGYTSSSFDGQRNNGSNDTFITKFNSDGSKVWTKLLGGESYDFGHSVSTASDGSIYIAGYTGGSIDGQINNGSNDAFITKFNSDGSKVWTKLLGGGSREGAYEVSTASDGSIYIVGDTDGSLDGQSNNGSADAFITKFNSDGSKVWTKLIGGASADYANSVITASDGSIYIAGQTDGSLDGQSNNGSADAFITKFNSDGSKVWTKLLGGASYDLAYSVSTASDGSIYIAGVTSSSFDGQSNNGTNDAFITKLNSDGSSSNTGTGSIYYNPTTNNTISTWNIYRVDNSVKAGDIVNQWFGTATPTSTQLQDISETKLMDVVASTWADKVQINRVVKASDTGGKIEAKQIEVGSGEVAGSVVSGGKGSDDIKGFAGWDNLEGGDGNDLIHGGNGRDIISGGAGRDELHGDFGWNTYKSEKDGVSDLIAVKSDQYLVNWLYGKAGNSPNGEKADIIEGLDSIDKIKLIGIDTREITFAANISAKGVTGIGIYGKGILEALYTGGDLTVAQITQMTSGDASAAAMSNSVNAYGVW